MGTIPGGIYVRSGIIAAMSRNISGNSYASTETWRLFVALPLPEAVRERIAATQAALRRHDWPVKWVDPALAHITLKFLGDTASDQVPAIEKALEDVVNRHKVVDAATGAVGAFPTAARPRIIWLGLNGDLSPLGALAADVDRTLADPGFPREDRPFRPHITMGRLRRGASSPRDFDRTAREIDASPINITFDRVQLVRSVLGSGGPVYTTLAAWELQAIPASQVELVEHG